MVVDTLLTLMFAVVTDFRIQVVYIVFIVVVEASPALHMRTEFHSPCPLTPSVSQSAPNAQIGSRFLGRNPVTWYRANCSC